LDDILLDAHLFAVHMVNDYFVDIAQFFCIVLAPPKFTIAQKKKLVLKETYYQLIA
jgi:hypothetical protein